MVPIENPLQRYIDHLLTAATCNATNMSFPQHGVKRPRPGQRHPEDVARAKAAKEKARVEEYTALRAQLAQCRADRDYSNKALDLTTRILTINPEYQSGWSFRRRIFLQGLLNEKEEQANQKLLEADLDLTSQCLRRNPKEYAVWEHRKWVLRTMPDPDWRYELKTIESLLEKDARNFHGWDYRRYLIECIQTAPPQPVYSTRKRPKPTTSSELAFTTAKISASFSNYSAWHYRSKLLPKLWEEQGLGPDNPARLKRVDEEFELVKQALYTDPDDQSAWIYHRWLVGQSSMKVLQREISVIEELTELEPESKWCLESLVYYKPRLSAEAGVGQRRESSTKESLERLEVLQRVDPLRYNRYKQLAQDLRQQ